MDPIHNTYDWLKKMRRVRRWRPGGPTVLAMRGAELVREKPSEVGIGQASMPTPESIPTPQPELAPESVPEPESAPESEPEPEPEPESSRRRGRSRS